MKTTDVCDAHPKAVRIAEPVFRDFGGARAFSGSAVTLRVRDDNVLVRAALEQPGEGRVLVVDGGGSLRCALLGDVLAGLGAENGWAGVVINGCVRDSADLSGIGLGVKALAVHPKKSRKQGRGEQDVSVAFAGVTIRPGDRVYADEDGLVIASEALEV